MTKTEKAIKLIDSAMQRGAGHAQAAEEAALATGLRIYSEPPAVELGTGPDHVASLPRGTRGALFDIHTSNSRFLRRHFV